MLSSSIVLVAATAVAWAMPYEPALDPRVVSSGITTSVNAICGAFNGSATCLGTSFGSCCSQFGYCGSSEAHCGTGCQVGYGSCGAQQAKTWNNLGCFADNTQQRVFTKTILVAGNTPAACQTACGNEGYTYAGVEFGSQCFCGSSLTNAPVQSTDCTMACPGDGSQTCGGSNAIQIYSVQPTWINLGCYSDSTNSRTLSKSVLVSGNTIEKCQAECSAGGYKYAGMEFGSQCFCGNSIDNGGAPIAQSTCNKACPGNSATTCGGPNALSLYYLL